MNITAQSATTTGKPSKRLQISPLRFAPPVRRSQRRGLSLGALGLFLRAGDGLKTEDIDEHHHATSVFHHIPHVDECE